MPILGKLVGSRQGLPLAGQRPVANPIQGNALEAMGVKIVQREEPERIREDVLINRGINPCGKTNPKGEVAHMDQPPW